MTDKQLDQLCINTACSSGAWCSQAVVRAYFTGGLDILMY